MEVVKREEEEEVVVLVVWASAWVCLLAMAIARRLASISTFLSKPVPMPK